MARICSQCGSAIPDGAGFCIECGARAPEAEAIPEQAAAAAAAPEPMPGPQPGAGGSTEAYPPNPPAAARYEAPDRSQKPVSTIGFWALKLVYAIPVVGFFVSLVLAIAPENKSLKHHALATFIWRIIILAFLIFGSIRFWRNAEVIWDQFADSIADIADGQGIEGLDELLDSLQNGGSSAGN